MGNVTLRDGRKVSVKSINYDASLDMLMYALTAAYTNCALDVLRALREIGEDAADIEPQLNHLLSHSIDRSYRQEIDRTLEVIRPKTPKKEVSVEIVQEMGTDLAKDAELYKKCNFCEKETLIKADARMDRLCPPGRFYCRFCLRHSLHNRDNRHILMLTMRAVLGYYFWQFYYSPPKPYMWLSEIKDYVALHEEVGMRNPVFNYDPETYTWFIDFNRVGDSKKKLPVKEVKQTVVEMLSVFNMHVHVKGLGMAAFYDKYADAIAEFYHKRYRPDGKRLLAPTFKGCGNPDWGNINHSNQTTVPNYGGNKMSIEDTKSFLPTMLVEHLWNKSA